MTFLSIPAFPQSQFLSPLLRLPTEPRLQILEHLLLSYGEVPHLYPRPTIRVRSKRSRKFQRILGRAMFWGTAKMSDLLCVCWQLCTELEGLIYQTCTFIFLAGDDEIKDLAASLPTRLRNRIKHAQSHIRADFQLSKQPDPLALPLREKQAGRMSALREELPGLASARVLLTFGATVVENIQEDVEKLLRCLRALRGLEKVVLVSHDTSPGNKLILEECRRRIEDGRW